MPLGARLEFVGVKRALAGEAGGLQQRRELPRPIGGRIDFRFRDVENALQQLAQNRRGLRGGDELRQSDGRVGIAPDAHVQARAARELGVRAAHVRRADEMARAREVDRRERQLDQRERGVHQRIRGERAADRYVVRQRRLCRICQMSRQVVARVHHAREDAHRFLPALAELGHHHADTLLALLEPRSRPFRGRL